MAVGQMTPQDIEELALSFPSLQTAEGVSPWEPYKLDAWAIEASIRPVAVCAAQFVLNLWDHRAKWRCGRFRLTQALAVWDANHRTVLIEQSDPPWWS